MHKRGLITKWIIIIIIVLGAAYFTLDHYGFGISKKEMVEQPAEAAPVAEPDPVAPADVDVVEEEPVAEPEDNYCTSNADCPGEQCIEGVCGQVSALYDTECENKCNYGNVLISTSDGESYTLNRGKGSYSYAGAVEWKLVGGPDYCPDENVPIPIKIIKKNAGEVLEEQVIVLHEGETSDVVTHPTIARVSFTATIESIEETCA